MFITSEVDFATRLGAYGKVTEKLDNGKFVVEFSAEADAVLQSLGLKAHLHQNLILAATRRREQPFLWETDNGGSKQAGGKIHTLAQRRVCARLLHRAHASRAVAASTDDRS